MGSHFIWFCFVNVKYICKKDLICSFNRVISESEI